MESLQSPRTQVFLIVGRSGASGDSHHICYHLSDSPLLGNTKGKINVQNTRNANTLPARYQFGDFNITNNNYFIRQLINFSILSFKKHSIFLIEEKINNKTKEIFLIIIATKKKDVSFRFSNKIVLQGKLFIINFLMKIAILTKIVKKSKKYKITRKH